MLKRLFAGLILLLVDTAFASCFTYGLVQYLNLTLYSYDTLAILLVCYSCMYFGRRLA